MNHRSSDAPERFRGSEADLRAGYCAALQAQTVRWRGQTIPLRGLRSALESPDRRTRERAWRQAAERRLADAPYLNELWSSIVLLRAGLATEAGFERYPELRRRQLGFAPVDPAAGRRARLAVEEFVTSVLVRLHERRRRQLGLRTIRPWDLMAMPPGAPTDQLYGTEAELADHLRAVLDSIQPAYGVGPVAPGAGALSSDAELEDAVDRYARAMAQVRTPQSEDAAATALRLLVLQSENDAGPEIQIATDVARSRIRHLERTLLRWAFRAMTDSLEEWIYLHPSSAGDDRAVGATWSSLWLRFLPAVDWAGLEAELAVEWQWHDALFLRPCESMARVGAEVMLFRDWIESTDVGAWFRALPSLGGERGAPAIDELDLLDVARWAEDTIEELERSLSR